MQRAMEGGASVTEAADEALAWGVRHPEDDLFEPRPYSAWEATRHDDDDDCGSNEANLISAQLSALQRVMPIVRDGGTSTTAPNLIGRSTKLPSLPCRPGPEASQPVHRARLSAPGRRHRAVPELRTGR
jgi:hypothetical protein